MATNSTNPRQPCPVASRALLLCGPTAAGKSEVALLLAQKLGGEIISVDSMQVYRGMDIGTAKPSPAERRRVRHHLIDVADLTQRFHAAEFVRLARQATEEILSRGSIPIFCGGTGLYFKAWLEGLGNTPPSDPQLRAELERAGLPELLSELAKEDPVTYERIDRQNPRRIIRAIEVIRLTGRPFSQQQASWRPGESGSRIGPGLFGLTRPMEELRARIDNRVEEMFRRGLVTETRSLLDRGMGANITAMQALGYRQVVEHLEGTRTLAETVELVKLRTRQFAKRQMTWFRRQLEVQWIPPAAAERPLETVDWVARAYAAIAQALGGSARAGR